ncbi:hydroxymethylpyrimidine/phosphomethylpyrimidine kinase [Massilia sp. YIM B02763]|uniref:bifunctional hydroxymethylpyrimidine kinase/phosphomethylpyrimidine kinase n=1 Tax=Massilia sp. YIM B02763 TaxID=3050130 RepID=UPI0025B67694|nr:hydroxymethylpyrimidine/phosphomethylpyrimidine kinase [Massilia sp. YIM B02763]MDN4056253.1 hydroxymethylpyrimidine/phosphomethylpyrimidine kinase [Massilia sp. YIM B02763]
MAVLPDGLRSPVRPSVLVFAGLDPSGGAGIAADIEAIAAQGAHALPIVTALTVQDNNRVRGMEPVSDVLLTRQAGLLAGSMAIAAVKIGIPGNLANAEAIADVVRHLRETRPELPVVLDPVLASGHGDALARGDALQALEPLLDVATVLVPNLPEAAALGERLQRCPHVLVTGGHGDGSEVVNRWTSGAGTREWRWPRLPGEFHGSGCTLASSIAARLALGDAIAQALESGQRYCNQSLADSYAIAPGQRIPRRIHP